MKEEIKKINIAKIQVGKHEQRFEEDPDDINILANSIGRLGMLTPLIVSSVDGGYTLVAGHRRLAAVKRLGFVEVSCVVREPDEFVDAETTFAENFCRKSLTPIEQAAAIDECYKNGSMSIEQMAKAFHRSEHWVQAQIEMGTWPEDVQRAIHNGDISVSAAHNLAMIDDDTYRGFLLETAINSGATARSTAAWLQGWRSSKSQEEAVKLEPVQGALPQQPSIPKMPCLCCSTVYPMTSMSHVPMCPDCIRTIRNIPNAG